MSINSTQAIVPVTQQNGTNPAIDWNQLRPKEWDIIIAVASKGSPVQAQKTLAMSHTTFYRNWVRLKPVYNELIQHCSKVASGILVSQTIKAVQVLSEQLASDDETVRFKAAREILNKVYDKNRIVENKIKEDIDPLELLLGGKVHEDNSLDDPKPNNIPQLEGINSHISDIKTSTRPVVVPSQEVDSTINIAEEPVLQEPELPAEDLSWQELIDIDQINNHISLLLMDPDKLFEYSKSLDTWKETHQPGPKFLEVKSKLEDEIERRGITYKYLQFINSLNSSL